MRAHHELPLEIERFLREHAQEMEPSRDPGVTAEGIEIVMDAIAHRAVLEHSRLSAAITAREAFALVMRYLKQPRPEATASSAPPSAR